MCIRDRFSTNAFTVLHQRQVTNPAVTKQTRLPSPLGTKKAGEHHFVGSSQGTIIPETMYFDNSSLASSWNRRGMGRGADTRYGTQLSLIYIFMHCAHIGLLSRVSKKMVGKVNNVFVFKSLKHYETAATAGKDGWQGASVSPANLWEQNG